ncbi:hypothetical protein AK972_1195 [Pseudomonas yamanorum]|nr:hypothetical protein AK972_1195 [Pseudomonas yamanorum]
MFYGIFAAHLVGVPLFFAWKKTKDTTPVAAVERQRGCVGSTADIEPGAKPSRA